METKFSRVPKVVGLHEEERVGRGRVVEKDKNLEDGRSDPTMLV